MGVAWFIVPKKEVPGLDCHVNGKAIAHVPEKKLTRICAELAVTPLMSFHSCDPEEMAEFFEGEGMDPPEEAMSPEQWFAAKDGLKTVRALLSHFRENPKAIKDSSEIIDDLVDFERVLAAIDKVKVPWHLAVDF